MDHSHFIASIRARQRTPVQTIVAGSQVTWPAGVLDQLPHVDRELHVSVASSASLQHLRDLLFCNLAPLELPRTECIVCHREFSSRGQLFKHLRASDHELQPHLRKSFWEQLPCTEIDNLVALASNLGIAHALFEDGPRNLVLDALSRAQYCPWRVQLELNRAEYELAAWLEALASKTHESLVAVRSFKELATAFHTACRNEDTQLLAAILTLAQDILKPWGFEDEADFNWRLQCLSNTLKSLRQLVLIDFVDFVSYVCTYLQEITRQETSRQETHPTAKERWQYIMSVVSSCCTTRSRDFESKTRVLLRNVTKVLSRDSLDSVLRCHSGLRGRVLKLIQRLVQLPDIRFEEVLDSFLLAIDSSWVTGESLEELTAAVVELSYKGHVDRDRLIEVACSAIMLAYPGNILEYTTWKYLSANGLHCTILKEPQKSTESSNDFVKDGEVFHVTDVHVDSQCNSIFLKLKRGGWIDNSEPTGDCVRVWEPAQVLVREVLGSRTCSGYGPRLVALTFCVLKRVEKIDSWLCILSRCVLEYGSVTELCSVVFEEPAFLSKWQDEISSATGVAMVNLAELALMSAPIREAVGSQLVDALVPQIITFISEKDVCIRGLACLQDLVAELAVIPASLITGLVECMRNLRPQGMKIVEIVRNLAKLISQLACRGAQIRRSMTDATCLCPLGAAIYERRSHPETVSAILELFRELLGPEHQIDRQMAEVEGTDLLNLLELPAASFHFEEVIHLMRHVREQGTLILSRLNQAAASDRRSCARAAKLMRVIVQEFQLCSPGQLAELLPTMLQHLAEQDVRVVDTTQELRHWIIFLDNCNLMTPPRQCILEGEGFRHLAAGLVSARRSRQRDDLRAIIDLTSFALGSQSDPDYILRRHAFEEWGPLEVQFQASQNNTPSLRLVVDPGNVFESAMHQVLNAFPGSLRPGKFSVEFRDQPGIDAGGLRRDFVAKAGLGLADVRLGLLIPAEAGYLQLSPMPGFLACGPYEKAVWEHQEQWCRYLGRLLGLSVAHDFPMGIVLVPSLCKYLMKEQPAFEDLQHVLGEQYYKSLLDCRKYPMLEAVSLEAPAVPEMKRLTTDEANVALYGQIFEVTSKPAIIFHALASHLAHGNLADSGFDVAIMLLRHAAPGPQRAAANEAATKFLCGLVAGICGMKAEDVCEMFTSEDALPDETVRQLRQVLPLDSLTKLLFWVTSVHSASTQNLQGLGQNIVCKVHGVMDISFEEIANSGAAPPPFNISHDMSDVPADDVSPGGDLNRSNLESFIPAVTEKVLVKNLLPHVSVIRDEFRLVIGPDARMQWYELQRTVAGDELDVETWSRATSYRGYTRTDPPVQWWWELIEEADAAARRDLFRWCTGYACMPAGGVRFILQRYGSPPELPRSSTCFSTVKLPPYTSKDEMRGKLAWALEESGFETG